MFVEYKYKKYSKIPFKKSVFKFKNKINFSPIKILELLVCLHRQRIIQLLNLNLMVDVCNCSL